MLNGLLKLIYDLNKSGIITIQRMCFLVQITSLIMAFTTVNSKSKLAENELRVDCPEHELQI